MTQLNSRKMSASDARKIVRDYPEQIRSIRDDLATLPDKVIGGLVGAMLFGLVYYAAVYVVFG